MPNLIDSNSKAVDQASSLKVYFHVIPYSGRWLHLDPEGRVEATYHLRNGVTGNMSFDEFKSYHSGMQFSELMSFEECLAVDRNWKRDIVIQGSAKQISTTDWQKAFSLMPPLRYSSYNGVQMFYSSEPYRAGLYTWYLMRGDSCLRILERRDVRYGDLYERFSAFEFCSRSSAELA